MARFQESDKTFRTRASVISAVVLLCFCSTLALSISGCFSKRQAVLDKTILEINQTKISTQTFSDRLAKQLKHQDALVAKDETVLDRAKEEIIKSFVFEVIARDYAKKSGIEVSDRDVDSRVNQIRSNYPDDIAFRRALGEENLSIDQWKKDIAFSLLQKKIFGEIAKGMNEPTEAEILSFYEKNKNQFITPPRVRLRQIVLEKEDDAKRILDSLNNHADFAKLAREFSVAPEGQNGGDTGWINKGTLEVFDLAFKMPLGSRSKILKSTYGYHIYDVIKKEPEAHLSFSEAKAKIRAQLVEHNEQVAFSVWLEKQVRITTVRRNDTLIRAIKVTTRGS
jgi:peptidyl-prolyl cis-trans isomerase C